MLFRSMRLAHRLKNDVKTSLKPKQDNGSNDRAGALQRNTSSSGVFQNPASGTKDWISQGCITPPLAGTHPAASAVNFQFFTQRPGPVLGERCAVFPLRQLSLDQRFDLVDRMIGHGFVDFRNHLGRHLGVQRRT